MAESAASKRTTPAVIIALFAVIGLNWIAPAYHYPPKGIVLPAQKTRPPNPANNVVIYTLAPMDFQTVGVVNIEKHYRLRERNAKEEIYQLAKMLASKVGANGVLIRRFIRTTPTLGDEAQANYYFQGLAIYTANRPFDFEKDRVQ